MGTKYATVTVSGYNATPPSDDGSVSSTNQVKWSTIKTKLPDPLKTAIEAIDAGLVAAFNYSARSITTGETVAAGDHMKTVEIAPTVSSVVTVTLPDAATMAAGYTVNIVNRTNFTAVIARATASDVLNGVAANEALFALRAVTYKVNSTTNGYTTVDKTFAAGSQAEMEAAASAAVFASPSNLKFHPATAKAWVTFNTAGVVPSGGSHNVTSVTDNGAGDFTVVIATDMSGTSYAALCTVGDSNPPVMPGTSAKLAGSFTIASRMHDGTLTDSGGTYDVVVYGDHA